MLQQNRLDGRLDEDFIDDGGGGFDLDFYLAIVRRRWKIILTGLLLGLILGFAYLATAIPLYTASTRLLIDTPDTRTSQEVSGVAEGIFESGEVDSQVELIRSEAIAAQVADSLNLVENPVFWEERRQPTQILIGWIQIGSQIVSQQLELIVGDGEAQSNTLERMDKSEQLLRRASAVARIRDDNRFSVSRIGRTYVLAISYTSQNRTLAAQIANGYAQAYIDDQLESKYSATRRASDWLLNRTEELKIQSANAEKAVEAFRQANGLVATSGTLITDQQLAEINGQLIAARAEVSRLGARYNRLSDIITNGSAGSAVSETATQGITNDLRARFLEASKRLAEITSLLGSSHAQSVRLRNEMAQLERLMFEELKRFTEVTRNELRVAQLRVASLENDLTALVGATNEANETQIQLRELERNANSLRGLYTTFLERYQESLQTQSFPISDARIITAAAPPRDASHPRRSLSLIAALLLGGIAGSGLAALQELRDRVFRTGDQVRDELGLEFIGMLPAVRPRDDGLSKAPTQSIVLSTGRSESPFKVDFESFNQFELQSAKLLTQRDPVMRYALMNPMSGFAETLRSAKVAADLTIGGEGAVLIGIASVLPAEGKTTISKNLASLVASQGARTLLIDGDIRNPGLTRGTARDSEDGLVETIIEGKPWRLSLRLEEESGLYILPTILKRRISHTSDLLTSPGMRQLLNETRSEFDYIFIDLPPMGPVVDVRAMLPILDGLVFVIEWGKTNRRMVRNIILEDHRLHDKALGVILNKVDIQKLKMYDGHHSKSYYYNRYYKYYSI